MVDGTRSALIVANSEYTDPGLRRLRAPARDAQALAAVLRDPGIGGFEVRTLLNEGAYEVNLAVEEFFADRRPDDLLLVHFSCHGVKDQDGELYFAAANTVLRALGATAVAAEFVNRRMSRSRSRRVVLLLDCCYAGAFERGMTARAGAGVGIEAQFGGRGRAVITASSAMEYAFEGGELADTHQLQPSIFTSALVQGLATGEADRDQDGMVALDELYDYVYDKVRAATPNQTPSKWAFGVQGDLYIARRARPVTTPAPLPPQLQEAIDSPFAAIRAAAVQELVRLLQGRHAGLALAARLALQRLSEDDSRAVVAAATEALVAQTPPAPPTPTPPTLALSATVAVRAQIDPQPLTASDAVSTTHPEAPTERPEEVGPGAAPASTPTTSPDRAVAAPAAEPAIGVDHRAARRRGADSRVLVAGQLAIVGAAVSVVGLFQAYVYTDSLWHGRSAIAEMRWYALYLLAQAGLIVGAGACTLIPRTRQLIGPGLLLGTVAASTWSLVYLASERVRYQDVPGILSDGWWVELVAHLVLVLAACLAGLALVRTTEVRLMRRPPQGQAAWLVALLGGAGALVLLFHDRNLWNLSSATHWYVPPPIWMTVMAAVVPACAALAVPRRFGVALLAGWIAGGTAFFGFYYTWDRYQYGGHIGRNPIITFGLTLLALSVVTVLFARTAPSSQIERATRG